MTSDSSVLLSLHSLDFPLSVLIADGTSLPVTSRGTLSLLLHSLFLMFLLFLASL
jgi:hypothetical protein